MYLWENHLAFSSYLLENFSNIDAKHREAALRTIITMLAFTKLNN